MVLAKCAHHIEILSVCSENCLLQIMWCWLFNIQSVILIRNIAYILVTLIRNIAYILVILIRDIAYILVILIRNIAYILVILIRNIAYILVILIRDIAYAFFEGVSTWEYKS